MAIGINDLDDDDDIVVSSQEPNPEPPSYTEEEDYMSDFLKSRGIDDPTKIQFEDDNNQIVNRSWNDLNKEEKLNILNMPVDRPDTSTNNDLSEEEVSFLNYIRQNNLTPSAYINSIQQPVQAEPVGPVYKIDELSDDEVYLLDLESRVGELTDEQAAQALSIAKQQSEDLYQKQIDGIRKEYKEREDFQTQQAQAQLEQEQQEAFNQYQAKVVDAIDNMTSIGNLDLNFEDSDKETLAEFMLSQDDTGKNYLYEALQDPEILTKAAWFILNGEDAFNSITDYFTNQIKLVSENQYKKGLEDGKRGISSRPSVVITNSQKINNHRQYNSIEDLDDDE